MRKRLRTVMFGIGLMILLAQPAFAEELGQANITPDMTMQEIRANPVMWVRALFVWLVRRGGPDGDAQPLNRPCESWRQTVRRRG